MYQIDHFRLHAVVGCEYSEVLDQADQNARVGVYVGVSRLGRRLHVLYLTHHAPWPAASGGRLRDAALVPYLADFVDLEVWAISRTYDGDRAAVDRAVPGFPVRVFPDEAPRRVFPTRDSEQARDLLWQRTTGDRPFDVVHVEGHYLAHLVPDQLAPRTLIVEHNVESHLLRQRSMQGDGCGSLADDLAAVSLAEGRAWARAARVLALSDEDRHRIERKAPDALVERCFNGADHVPRRTPPAFEDDNRVATAPRIGYLANYAYPPNQDATHWLLDKIFPQIRDRIPQAELVLAGSHLQDVVDTALLPPYVKPLGWVPHVERLWDAVDIVVCPLRIGGGVKVKMIEAVRGGCLIVSTSIGLEGLPDEARTAVVRADSTDELVDATVRLCKDPELRRQHRARLALAQDAQPTWAEAASALYEHWSRISETGVKGHH